MGQEVESLQAYGVSEIGRVGMGCQRLVSVRRVGFRQVWYKIVETSVMSIANGPDGLQEFLCGLGRLGAIGNENKAIRLLQ